MISNEEDFKKLTIKVFPTLPLPFPFFQDGIIVNGKIIANPEFPNELLKYVSNRKWTDVALDDWRYMGCPIDTVKEYVTPSTFRYYLPSILLNTVNDPSWMELGLLALLPNNQKRIPRGNWWKEYIEGFNKDQKDAVLLYLNFMEKIAATGSINQSWIELAKEFFSS